MTSCAALEDTKQMTLPRIALGVMLGIMKNFIVLYVQNFKRIENYAPLITLNRLEQLIISGPTLGRTLVKDLEFLRELQSLVSVWLPNTKLIRKSTLKSLWIFVHLYRICMICN